MKNSEPQPIVAADEATMQSARRWWLLIAMCTAQLMVILDATIVNIALPDAQASLGFTQSERPWVVTAYALTFGSLLLVGGRVADRIGRRRAILIGLVGFGLTSALGGAAVDFSMLVTARALQGVFGALLAPATLAVISTTFTDERERAKAFGIFGSVAAGGGAAGLLLGGVLTEYASWRWTLYVNTVLALVGVVGALLTLNHHEPVRGKSNDLAGTLSVTIGLFGLVFGFANAYDHGWTDLVTLVCLTAGVLLVASFVLIESRTTDPILPLRVLASRVRGASLLVLFLGSVGLFAESLFLTYYLQENLGLTPIEAGLAFLPQTIGAVVASLASGILLRRMPASTLIPAGVLITAAGLFLLGRLESADGYATLVLPGVTLVGAGLGLALSLAVNRGIQGVGDEDAGVASATVNAVQQMGGSIGPSLFNTLAGTVLTGYVAANGARLASSSVSDDEIRAMAAVHSYSVSFDIAAAILVACALLSAWMLRERPDRLTTDERPSQPAGASA